MFHFLLSFFSLHVKKSEAVFSSIEGSRIIVDLGPAGYRRWGQGEEREHPWLKILCLPLGLKRSFFFFFFLIYMSMGGLEVRLPVLYNVKVNFKNYFSSDK